MKILMVCLGNICRSPLAEGIMKHKLKQFGIDAEVDSAGTAAYHVGERPDPRSVQVALKNGIDITYQRARKFMNADFDRFDKIFAMDSFNYNDLLDKAQTEDDKEKVMMILEKTNPGKYKSVPDPYYGGADGFDKVFTMLDNACEIIAKELLNDEK